MTDVDVVDLDDLVPPPRTVKFAGATYKVPGDLPMVTYLKISRIDRIANTTEDEAEQQQAVEDLIDTLIELFSFEVTETTAIDASKLRDDIMRLGLSKVTAIISRIYGARLPSAEDGGEIAEPGPPVPEPEVVLAPEAGTTPTSTPPPTPQTTPTPEA